MENLIQNLIQTNNEIVKELHKQLLIEQDLDKDFFNEKDSYLINIKKIIQEKYFNISNENSLFNKFKIYFNKNKIEKTIESEKYENFLILSSITGKYSLNEYVKMLLETSHNGILSSNFIDIFVKKTAKYVDLPNFFISNKDKKNKNIENTYNILFNKYDNYIKNYLVYRKINDKEDHNSNITEINELNKLIKRKRDNEEKIKILKLKLFDEENMFKGAVTDANLFVMEHDFFKKINNQKFDDLNNELEKIDFSKFEMLKLVKTKGEFIISKENQFLETFLKNIYNFQDEDYATKILQNIIEKMVIQNIDLSYLSKEHYVEWIKNSNIKNEVNKVTDFLKIITNKKKLEDQINNLPYVDVKIKKNKI